MAKMVCSYCGGVATLRPGNVIWPGRDLPSLYICENYPRCDTYVRCHQGSDRPMGTLAGPRLRKLRGMAHQLFDPLWQVDGVLGREAAYQAAAQVMGAQGEFHIGSLDESGCESFIDNIDRIQEAFDVLVQQNQSGITNPASAMDMDLMLALYHPNEETYHHRIPKEKLLRYQGVAERSLGQGWIWDTGVDFELTNAGRVALFGV